MPRDIPVGNGRFLLCFDHNYCIRDIYFPHVGQENHVMGNYFRFGVWIDNIFSWVGPDWKIDIRYMTDSIVSEVSLYHKELAILINCKDAVDFHENIYLRDITVENLSSNHRKIRLFFSHTLNISGNDVGDTATHDPKSGGIIHYKGARFFLANGITDKQDSLAQIAVGQKNMNGKIGAYKDAENGSLSGNSIAQGSVDSVFALHLEIEATSSSKAFYWLTAAKSWEEVRRLDHIVKHRGPEALIKRTADYWKLWVHKETPSLEYLPEKIGDLYRRSLLVLNTQIDWNGGIIAANDSDVVAFNRDTYSYIWPRDGALVANALDNAGYPVISQKFYQFASKVIEKDGYFLHKFNPDETLASSWHPWTSNGIDQLPIQEDETALVLWALWNHFIIYRDIEFIKPLYRPLVKQAADFMCDFIDENTGLPAPSYDLWEERRGIHSFTTGTVFGGLTAASLFCTVFGEEDKALYYKQVASKIRDAASQYLWREDQQKFCRMISHDDQGNMIYDNKCDASIWGLFAFGLYEVDDPRIVATMKVLREKLWVKSDIGGMARYEDDYYHKVSDQFPGNPWFICTLWYADYLTGLAKNEKDLAEPLKIMQWVADHTLPSGVLAEQVNPLTGDPLSVSPLTWSHATYVASTQKILRVLSRQKSCSKCGRSNIERRHGSDWLTKLYKDACNEIHGICSVK